MPKKKKRPTAKKNRRPGQQQQQKGAAQPLESREQFDAAVAPAERLTVVTFEARWSKPSKALGASISSAIAADGALAAQAFFVDMDTDEGEELALELGVKAPPTVQAFRGGCKLEQFTNLPDATAAATLGRLSQRLRATEPGSGSSSSAPEAAAAQEALSEAAAAGECETIVSLLQSGTATVNGTTPVNLDDGSGDALLVEDWTALHVAARMGQLEAARVLLDHGAEPDMVARAGATTPLMVAIIGSSGRADLVSLLLERGASPLARGPEGATPFHFACEQELGECALALISAGCDAEAVDKDGVTGMQILEMMENVELAAVLTPAIEATSGATPAPVPAPPVLSAEVQQSSGQASQVSASSAKGGEIEMVVEGLVVRIATEGESGGRMTVEPLDEDQPPPDEATMARVMQTVRKQMGNAISLGQVQLSAEEKEESGFSSEEVLRIQRENLMAEGYRFAIGTRVECCVESGWAGGVVVAHNYRESAWPPGKSMPYQVRLDDGRLISAPADDDRVIRKEWKYRPLCEISARTCTTD